MKDYEVSQCFRCLNGQTIEPAGLPQISFGLPPVFERTDPIYQFWQSYQIADLIQDALESGESGIWRERLLKAPAGAARADLLTSIAVEFIKAGRRGDALVLLDEVVVELEREGNEKVHIIRLRAASSTTRFFGPQPLKRRLHCQERFVIMVRHFPHARCVGVSIGPVIIIRACAGDWNPGRRSSDYCADHPAPL